MYIKRALEERLVRHLNTMTKGIILYGPRQAGKTTLVNKILNSSGLKTLNINADFRGAWWNNLVSREPGKIRLLISGYDAVFIDEAQRIPEIGLILKIILDNFREVKVIATGSSSLDLASKVSEPLTGRAYTYKLFPIAQSELNLTYIQKEEAIEERLIYGSYPEVFSLPGREEKITYLNNLVSGYLYKDLLEFGDIRNSGKILDLLKLLAFQIGSQVSLTELSRALETSRGAVERYIDLLEKSFVIFYLSGLARNLRKEVTKMKKIYFWDTGVRNAVIGNFNLLKDRDDAARLWENFVITERMKSGQNSGNFGAWYFWRLTSGAEIDFVEEDSGKMIGYEIKYSGKSGKKPQSWNLAYPEAGYETINKDNWQDYL